MIVKWTTEIVVTNQRFIYKEGWIRRDVQELKLDRIEEVNFKQGFIGRILGFGTLKIRGVGTGVIVLPEWLKEPLELRTVLGNAKFEQK